MCASSTTAAEQDAWLSAPLEEAVKLLRPLSDDALRIVAMVEKADEWVPQPRLSDRARLATGGIPRDAGSAN